MDVRVISVPALLLLIASTLCGGSPQEARRLFREGQKAERAGQLAQAYVLYTRALAEDPGNLDYWLRGQALRVPARMLSDQVLPEPGVAKGPLPEAARAPRQAAPPIELKASAQRIDIDLTGDAKTLFTEVARLYRLLAIFDTDYPAGAPFRLRLSDADYRDALYALETAAASIVVPETEGLFLVVKDTPQKRNDLEPVVTVTVPVSTPLTAQEAQDLMRGVQQAAGLASGISLDAQHGVIVIKDRVSRVRPAQALIEQLLRQRAMVSIQVEFVETSRSASTSYGISPQTAFPLVDFGSLWRSTPSIPSGFANFAVFGGGRTLLGLGIATAQALASMSDSGGRILFRTEIRSLDGQQASIHVGDKYPVATARYLSSSASDQFSMPPTITFQDIGLTIQVTPHVNGVEEVTLKLDAEFKALTGQVVDEIPVISSRKLESDVRVRNGEWAVVAGLLNSSQAKTISGLAGLSRVPLVGPLFSKRGRDETENQVLVVLKPVLLSLPPTEATTSPIWLGTEQRPRAPL